MKRYQLQKQIGYDTPSKTETWKQVYNSDSLKALILVCPEGFRIIDTQDYGKVVYLPEES